MQMSSFNYLYATGSEVEIATNRFKKFIAVVVFKHQYITHAYDKSPLNCINILDSITTRRVILSEFLRRLSIQGGPNKLAHI